VQATDQYVGTLRARIVLVDDSATRAIMTASWLRQMGFADVSMLVERGTETKAPESPILGAPPPPEAWIDCDALSALLAGDAATVIDLSLSREYFKAHIPGAFYAIRSQFSEVLRKVPLRRVLVLTSEDGVLAGLAVAEASALANRPVHALHGGNAAWRAAGFPRSAEPLLASDPIDLWLKPYERPGDTAGAMADYLSWETDLLARIARDGTCNFMRPVPP
jgi:rhodanese-related sulfurtransferase